MFDQVMKEVAVVKLDLAKTEEKAQLTIIDMEAQLIFVQMSYLGSPPWRLGVCDTEDVFSSELSHGGV